MDRRIQQLGGAGARMSECELERELKRSRATPRARRAPIRRCRSARSKDPSGRKRGAQDGHEGHGRPLLPAWAVDEVVAHWPSRCRCGHCSSARAERALVGTPACHQVEELPPINVG